MKKSWVFLVIVMFVCASVIKVSLVEAEEKERTYEFLVWSDKPTNLLVWDYEKVDGRLEISQVVVPVPIGPNRIKMAFDQDVVLFVSGKDNPEVRLEGPSGKIALKTPFKEGIVAYDIFETHGGEIQNAGNYNVQTTDFDNALEMSALPSGIVQDIIFQKMDYLAGEDKQTGNKGYLYKTQSPIEEANQRKNAAIERGEVGRTKVVLGSLPNEKELINYQDSKGQMPIPQPVVFNRVASTSTSESAPTAVVDVQPASPASAL